MAAPGNWQKSSFSGSGDGNNCIELASTPTTLHTTLTTTTLPLAHLLRHIRSGALVSTPA
ncbi:DUF397 domain-containing protein [Streptomyces sp. NPDC005485]|uniref:DUF397 domain-containing protein n=1 Tax=Streptomyces sp. NPDC005485 TaxID=3155591 RepID=UPI0033BBBA37